MATPDGPKADEADRPQRPHPNESENQPGFDPDGERRQADRGSPEGESEQGKTAPPRGDRFERRKKQWEGGGAD